MVEEHKMFTFAETVGNGGLVCLPVAQMQVDYTIAAELRLDSVVIYAWRLQYVSKKVVSVIFADGFKHVGFFVRMHHDGDADILGTQSVTDVTGIGGCPDRWRGNRTLDVGVVKGVGGCPAVGVVACAA